MQNIIQVELMQKGVEPNLRTHKPVGCLLVLEDAQSVALPVN